MIRSIIISQDQELAASLEKFFRESGGVGVIRRIEKYPDAMSAVRLVRIHAPQAVFLDIEMHAKAAEIVAAVEESLPGIQFIAVHGSCDRELLLGAMRLGIKEFLSPPFHREPYFEMVERVQALLDRKPPATGSTNHVYSFLPAKAGVGTSTIALNLSAAISRQCREQVLLCDLDLNSGMIRFMLKLENLHSIIDASSMIDGIDEDLWPQMVSEIGQLHVLHSGRVDPEARLEAFRLHLLLELARRNYHAICLDLSGNLEKFSIEVMHESKRIFLVCTAELPSLHLAREKCQYLRSLDLGDKISVIVNRAQRRSLVSTEQIEKLLNLPVEMIFSNDYKQVQWALHEGRLIDPASELGQEFSGFAETVMNGPAGIRPEPGKKRSGLFALPGRFGLFLDGKKTAV